MEKQRFFAPGQMRRIYAAKSAGDLSQRNSSCNQPDSLNYTNYDRVARSFTDEELMDLVEFERRGDCGDVEVAVMAKGVDGDDGFFNLTLVAHATTGRNGLNSNVMIDTQNDSSANDCGDVKVAVMAKDSFSIRNGHKPMPRFGVDGDDGFFNLTLVAHATTGRNGLNSNVMIDTQNDSSANDCGDVEVAVMAKALIVYLDSFSIRNGHKPMPRFGVDGDDGFSNSTLVAHAATGRNGLNSNVMIDTQNDSSANDCGDVEVVVMAKDSFSIRNGRKPMPRF
ncbi:hypothetical protein Dimus_030580, partial [Dionaea muscipula]